MKITLNLSLLQLHDLKDAAANAKMKARKDMLKFPGQLLYQMWYERAEDTYQQLADVLECEIGEADRTRTELMEMLDRSKEEVTIN
jgi:hypothetical protein